MRRIVSITLILLLFFDAFVLCGCRHDSNYDKEQVYHEGYEEFEHYINDELGDYLSIVRYQEPSEDGSFIFIDVYFRSSYYDNYDRKREMPVWKVIDRFRCRYNDFVRNNPGYFHRADSTRIEVCFWYDEGHTMNGHVFQPCGELSSICLSTDRSMIIHNDEELLINLEYDYADYSQLEDKEDVICLYINIPGQYQAGEADEESINECVDYVCGVIDEFPNLQMFRIVNAPIAYSAMDQITNRVIERFEDRELYEGY